MVLNKFRYFSNKNYLDWLVLKWEICTSILLKLYLIHNFLTSKSRDLVNKSFPFWHSKYFPTFCWFVCFQCPPSPSFWLIGKLVKCKKCGFVWFSLENNSSNNSPIWGIYLGNQLPRNIFRIHCISHSQAVPIL